jgi:hypothetical protein
MPGLARPLPSLARLPRAAPTAKTRPSLQVRVRHGVRYWAEIYDPRIRRSWRCRHRHPTRVSAAQCAQDTANRIDRLGWERATRRRKPARRRLTLRHPGARIAHAPAERDAPGRTARSYACRAAFRSRRACAHHHQRFEHALWLDHSGWLGHDTGSGWWYGPPKSAVEIPRLDTILAIYPRLDIALLDTDYGPEH